MNNGRPIKNKTHFKPYVEANYSIENGTTSF